MPFPAHQVICMCTPHVAGGATGPMTVWSNISVALQVDHRYCEDDVAGPLEHETERGVFQIKSHDRRLWPGTSQPGGRVCSETMPGCCR